MSEISCVAITELTRNLEEVVRRRMAASQVIVKEKSALDRLRGDENLQHNVALIATGSNLGVRPLQQPGF